MGTTRSGRVFNLQGSRNIVGDYALVHSNEGTFTKPVKKDDVLRLKSGGHGQDGMNLLDKYNIPYNITQTYENGVRVGNLPTSTNKLKKTGNSQSWFPASWNDSTIKKAGEYVSKLKQNSNLKNGECGFGTYKGVRVGIIITNDKIGTVFPDVDQTSVSKIRK